MLFTQLEFFIFFAILFILNLVLDNSKRKIVLLLASYYFYAYWDYRFLSLILISTAADYTIGLLLAGTENRRQRLLLMLASLAVNFGILGFFKYCNFFIGSLQTALAPLGLNLQTLNIILPIGISFYTFQTLSYTIDVYRGHLQPCRNFFDFALFVAFFPQLVAGPIVRASDFLPQLERKAAVKGQEYYWALEKFAIGFFKKVFIADRLALYVDNVLKNVPQYSGLTLWLVMISFALQIYCDFSGYSDMAIGVAQALGFRLNENFNLPYLAVSVQEFWRRWHISLSTWLKDYLYISLGGSRKGKARTYANLLITMVLGGLWHGAAWNFVFWGFWHGLLLAVDRKVREKWPVLFHHGIVKLLGWGVTFQFVVIGWVFFRVTKMTEIILVLKKMYTLAGGVAWYSPFAIAVIAAFVFVHLFETVKDRILPHRQKPAFRFMRHVAVAVMILLAILFYPSEFRPFIYFQF